MVTEEQKKVFKERLNEVFTIANEKVENEEVQATGQLRTWLRNLYFRYKNYKNNTHPGSILPQEHLLVLETKLNEENLSLDEFEKTEGKIDILVETIKTKKENPKEMTLEEMEKFRNETEEECRELERKLNKRKLYRLTDEECVEYQRKIDEYKDLIRDIKKKIDESTPKEEKPKEESEAANKKIEELLSQKRKQDNEINSLKEEVAKYKEERSYIKSKYKEEYDKKFEVYSNQLKEEYDKKLEKEVEKQISKANQKSEKTLELQKAHILRMLLKNDSVSIDEIKMKLENHKVSPANLDVAINELRVMIPGITKFYDLSKQETVLSINARATDRWYALKENSSSTRISNVFDGKVQFLEESDLHLDLKSTEDDLKRLFEPTFDYASTNGNQPVINIGDLIDTLKEIEFERWQNNDKEAIELSIKFLKNFAKVLATVPRIKYYFLEGNHEKHLHYAGIDPLEIINEYCNNLIPLGAEKGSFMLGNDKIGVFHGFNDMHKDVYKGIVEDLPDLAADCIYSLIGHYHKGHHKPLYGCSIVKNGLDNILSFQATLKDGNVIGLSVTDLSLQDNKLTYANSTSVELYSSNLQYTK